MLRLLLAACLVVALAAPVKLEAGVPYKTFGTAIKNGHLSTAEQTIFEHKGSGVVTEMWMTGGWDGFALTRVRIYVDGEVTPSIDYQLYMAHGIGWSDDSTVQGNSVLGKNAHGGGIYHTYRIPFGSDIKITATLDHAASNVFWFIVRGVDNFPIMLGDVQLPATARLKLYKNENVTVKPLEYTTLASVTGSGGAVFLVTIAATSSDENFLEACVRYYVDGAASPIFLSSGTEDFFLSAFYYNGGTYFTSESGLTHNEVTNPVKLSMFKFFQRDPLFFSTGMSLVWRNQEDAACPTSWPPPAEEAAKPVMASANTAPMVYTSYVWVYEW